MFARLTIALSENWGQAQMWILLSFLVTFLTALIAWIKRNEEKFLKQAREILANNNVTYDQIHAVSESWHIERERLLLLLKTLLGEALAGKTGKPDLISKLIEEHKSRTPFSELPENISLQLTALSSAYPNAKPHISQLAGSLSDLYSKNQSEIQKQKKITYFSLVVGVIGLIASIVIPLLPRGSINAAGSSQGSQTQKSPTPTPTP